MSFSVDRSFYFGDLDCHCPRIVHALNLQLGSSLSLYGCCKYQVRIGNNATTPRELVSERGSYTPPILGESVDATEILKSSGAHNEVDTRQKANIWVYVFQIIFQVGFSFHVGEHRGAVTFRN